MSDNVLKNGQQVARSLAKSKLLNDEANLPLHTYLQSLKKALASEVEVPGTNKLVPRFGGLSLLAASTGFFVYDHPDLVAQIPTAFACGDYVFFSAPFLKQLKEDSNDSAGFVGLHELMHINLLHALRLRDINPELANMAMDMFINTRQRMAFESSAEATEYRKSRSQQGDAVEPIAVLRYGDTVRCGVGFKEGDLKKYGHLSEEEIAKIMAKEIAEELRKRMEKGEFDQPQQGGGGGGGMQIDLDELEKIDPQLAKELREKMKNQPGKPGKGQSGKGQPGEGEPQEGEGGGDPGEAGKPGKPGKPGVQGPSSGTRGGPEGTNPNPDWRKPGSLGQSDKVLTENELRDLLKEIGVDGAADKLDLAKSKDESDKRSEQRAIKAKAAADESARLHKEAGVKLAGSHIDSMMLEVLGDIAKPKMSYTVALHHTICGGGKQTQYTEENAAPIYYVDPADMNMSSEIYLGSHIPFQRKGTVLVIIDTSGSMSTMDLKSAVSEIAGIGKDEFDDITIVLCWADTVIRAVEVLSIKDIEEKTEWGVPGRGGTHLTNCIVQGMDLPIIKKAQQTNQLAGLIYYSDLGDTPPARASLPKKLPGVCYVATDTASGVTQFRRAVGDYAQVVEIRPGLKVDLDKKKVTGPTP